MNRRNFFATSAAAAAGLAACNKIEPKTDQPPYREFKKEYAPKQKVTLLKTLTNDFLSVKIFSNSLLQIADLKNERNWETWPVAIQDKGIIEEGDVW
jgi:hypothetical protein